MNAQRHACPAHHYSVPVQRRTQQSVELCWLDIERHSIASLALHTLWHLGHASIWSSWSQVGGDGDGNADWCALVGLVGGGQEINTGENGMKEWGDAIRGLDPSKANRWRVFGPPTVLDGDRSTAFLGLGAVPNDVDVVCDEALCLEVSLRSFRSPRVADWVAGIAMCIVLLFAGGSLVFALFRFGWF